MSTLTSTPPAPAPKSEIPSLPSIPRLTHESNLLLLLFHRNKNQHRPSKWWKDLSILRSNVRRLICELQALEDLQKGKSAPSQVAVAVAVARSEMTKTQIKKLRKMAKEKARREANGAQPGGGGLSAVDAIVKAREKVDARLRLMRRGSIPKAWVAFTSVIATTQFSALGMVLLGVLGRIYEIVGPGSLAEQEEMKAVEENRVRGGMGREGERGWGWGGRKGGRSGWVQGEEESEMLGGEGFDDGGVIISRRTVDEEEEFLEQEDEEEGLGTVIERMEGVGSEGSEVPSLVNAVEDREMRGGESELETARQTPTIAPSEEEPGKRKKEKLKKSEARFSSSSSSSSPPPRPPRPPESAPTIPDLDFFSSSSTTLRITSTPSTTKPEKRKAKPESTKNEDTDKPKKKKKKGNAIDDLFKGLI